MSITKEILKKLNDLSKLINENDDFDFREVIEVGTDTKITKLDEYVNLVIFEESAKEFLEEYNKDPQKFIDLYDGGGNKVPTRINEFGNMIEKLYIDYFMSNFNDDNIYSIVELASTGYPDAILKKKDKYIHIEMKTFGEGKKNSSFRSFYYSYGKKTKVKNDGYHILIGFETSKKKSSYNINSIKGTTNLPEKLLSISTSDLHDLEVKLKVEFNTGNSGLYSKPKGE